MRRLAGCIVSVASLAVVAGCGAVASRKAPQAKHRALVVGIVARTESCAADPSCVRKARASWNAEAAAAAKQAERRQKHPCKSDEVLLVAIGGTGRCISEREAREWGKSDPAP